MALPNQIDPLLIGPSASYTVGRSLRFRLSASAYLNRTPASSGNRQKWTMSFWLKRGLITNGSLMSIYGVPITAGGHDRVSFEASADALQVFYDYGGANYAGVATNAVLRDPSAWYHCMIAMDTTQATQANRAIFYINGVQQSTNNINGGISQNFSWHINENVPQNISRWTDGSAVRYFDGYLAEFYFIDGQQLTASSFGEYDVNGVWQPKKYTGTYGTNGYYLPFSDTSNTTNLCKDFSGNGNNWTPNNISLTNDYTYDSMLDSPTNGPTSSNWCVLNPLSNNGYTISYANLIVSNPPSGGAAAQTRGTIAVSSGKWYIEFSVSSITGVGTPIFGFVDPSVANTVNLTGSSSAWLYYGYNGNKYNGSGSAYGSTFGSNDNISVALDMDAGTITFYKNNVSQGTAFTNLAGKTVVPVIQHDGSSATYTVALFAGQNGNIYSAPSGYNKINTYNLPQPTITNGAQYMASTLYTGNGSTQSIANSQNNGGNNALGKTFYPDLVWGKARSSSSWWHILVDSVRGAGRTLSSNVTNAEIGSGSDIVPSLNSNGFSLNVNPNGSLNENGTTYVGWQWNAGSGTTSTNTSGSITSTVSVNQTAGFSIVTYTGTGSTASVGHGLGVAPEFIIVKRRDAVQNWMVVNNYLTNYNWYLILNSSSAQVGDATIGNIDPTSTIFNIGTNALDNASGGTYVAYCWASIKGYSAFGSYLGTGGVDGNFVYTGFRPRWVLIKSSTGAYDWVIIDTSRDTYNVSINKLFPDLIIAESNTAYDNLDILSNGFKIRGNSGSTNNNASGATYIYAAFAENPFKISRAR